MPVFSDAFSSISLAIRTLKRQEAIATQKKNNLFTSTATTEDY